MENKTEKKKEKIEKRYEGKKLTMADKLWRKWKEASKPSSEKEMKESFAFYNKTFGLFPIFLIK